MTGVQGVDEGGCLGTCSNRAAIVAPSTSKSSSCVSSAEDERDEEERFICKNHIFQTKHIFSFISCII